MNKNQEVISNEDLLGRIRVTYKSIKEHLAPEYRKQHNIKRLIGCFWIAPLVSMVYGGSALILYPSLIWTFIAWKFWHYCYWSFQGGIIDSFSHSILHIGSIPAILGRMILQNIIIVLWIAFISPISGVKTWLKALKYDKVLSIKTSKDDEWK